MLRWDLSSEEAVSIIRVLFKSQNIGQKWSGNIEGKENPVLIFISLFFTCVTKNVNIIFFLSSSSSRDFRGKSRKLTVVVFCLFVLFLAVQPLTLPADVADTGLWQRRRRRQRKRQFQNEFALFETSSRLFQFALNVKCRWNSLGLNSWRKQKAPKFRRRKKNWSSCVDVLH